MLKFVSPEQGFLGLQDDAVTHRFDEAKACIVPYGLEASVSYEAGTAKGPTAIINASHQVELFDEVFWKEPYRDYGVATLEAPSIPSNLDDAIADLEQLTHQLLDADKFPLFLGGEHAITAGIMAAFAKRFDDITILHFDAHADLRDGYEGVHYSHASALRRCLDHDNVSLVSLGIRNISQEEIPFLESNPDRIQIYWAKDKKHWDMRDIMSRLKNKKVYLSFDVDGFDGSLMPATGTPEPGGLFWDDVMPVIEEAAKVSHIIGADICELAPRDGMHACDFLAAKLAYKILSFALAAPQEK
jgi:N1-aminopropylagmatine ureohydrolase